MDINNRQLQNLYKQLGVKNLLVVNLSSSRKQGDRFLLPNGKEATCLRDIPKGQAIALLTDKGNWYLVGGEKAEGSTSAALGDRGQKAEGKRSLEFRRTKYRRKMEKANIKILFSVQEGSECKFYVGGDRSTPTYLFSIVDPGTIKAHIDNFGSGKNDFAVTVWAEEERFDSTISGFRYKTRALAFVNGEAAVLLNDKESTTKNLYIANYIGNGALYYAPIPTDKQITDSDSTDTVIPECAPATFIEEFEVLPTESFQTDEIKRTNIQFYEYQENDGGGAICAQRDQQQEYIINYSSESPLLQKNDLQNISSNIIENFSSYIDYGTETKTIGSKTINVSFNDFSYTLSRSVIDGTNIFAFYRSTYEGTAILELSQLPVFYGKSATLKQELKLQYDFIADYIHGDSGAGDENLERFLEKETLIVEDNIYLSSGVDRIALNQETTIKIFHSFDANHPIQGLNNPVSVDIYVVSEVELSELIGKPCLFGTYDESNNCKVAEGAIASIELFSESFRGSSKYKIYRFTFNVGVGEVVPYASFVKKSFEISIVNVNNSIQQILLNPVETITSYDHEVVEDTSHEIISRRNPYSYYRLPYSYDFMDDVNYNFEYTAAEAIDRSISTNTGYRFLENFYRINLIKNKFYICDENLDVKNQNTDIYVEEWAIANNGDVTKTKLFKSKAYSLQSPSCTIHSIQYYA